ncbi:hypothetical protein BGZ94_007778 [Podila epigama]|nr:hypothetical protein BGZ94_007778 [Podila epigama]
MTSTSFSIPIAFWPRDVSVASISTSLTCDRNVIVGLEDGLIWVLHGAMHEGCGQENVERPEENKESYIELEPRSLLVGHNTRITALAAMYVQGDSAHTWDWILISVSQDGILSVSSDFKLSIWVFDVSTLAMVKTKVFNVCTRPNATIVALVASNRRASWAAVVCRECVQVVCLDSQKQACYVIPCAENESFAGAEFISDDDIVLWTQSGHVFAYSILELQQPDFERQITPDGTAGQLASPTTKIFPWSKGSLLSDENPVVTCSYMVSDNTVAFGFANGDIWVSDVESALPLMARGLSVKASGDNRLPKGHTGPVRCIFTSDELMERSLLLTGGDDCSTRIWNVSARTETACFNNHSLPVTHFLQVPDDVNSRIRRSVISVAEDYSVAVISIEEMSCIFLFGAYEHPLKAIQWRPPEDYIVLSYADGAAFVWQIILSALTPLRPNEIQNEGAFSSKTPQTGANTELAVHGSRKRIFSSQSRLTVPGGQSPIIDNAPSVPSNKTQQCLDAAKAVLSLLVTENDAYAQSIRKLLNLPSPVAAVALGIKGTYGNISLQSSLAGTQQGGSWCVSPTLTASKFVAVLSLSKAIAQAQNVDVDLDTWSRGYCGAVQDIIGPQFSPPSLSFLVKYWQDPQAEIQEAAKIVLLSTIERLSKADVASLVKYWFDYLPASALPGSCSSQHMARSTIILGILGAEKAEALPERVRKLVALSLTILLNDDQRVSYKVASIDLLAQGFKSWQSFIRADTVLKTLFALAMDEQSGGSLVSRRAKRAVAQIAGVNHALFVATLTQEILECKRVSEKTGLLKLISIIARKSPSVLYSGIPKLSEAIVKSLDPTISHVREAILPVGTSVLLDLVQSFPQIDVHVGSQKLAVGTLEGAIIVYDLQTATRWQILEGHTKAVSAVSFSKDGKTIISCSIKEGNVRLWHPNPGFFGMLMGGGSLWGGNNSTSSTSRTSSGSHSSLPSLSSQHSSRTMNFALQESILTGSEETMCNNIKFDWTGDRVVKLSVFDHIMSFNI